MKSVGLSRREFHRLMVAAGVGLIASPASSAGYCSGAVFVHPGILHTTADLERMQRGVRSGRQPIAAGFEKLHQHPLSSPAYMPHRFAEEIGRNPNINFGEFDSDAGAAYQCALMAAITGARGYAAVSRRVVLGWSASLQRVSGADAVLMAGLGPFKLVNAAEILRHLGELDQQDAASCAAMLRRAILPTIIDFAPFANGNWDTAAIKTMLAIAVFCEDVALFERALLYYLHGDGDGRLTHYIYATGQCQESGRDQQHTQLGLAHMGDACQIAWNQGWDLYGACDNRLLSGFEYTAAYNLGEKVEFRPDADRTGRYRHSVISPPGSLRPVYEQILAHYQMRRGVPAPAVQRVVQKFRPEGAAHGADHTGFGTLLYACTPEDADPDPGRTVPAALHASFDSHSVKLDWVATRSAASATLTRQGRNIQVSLRSSGCRDTGGEAGKLYTYRISAPAPTCFPPAPVSILTGLPAGWTSAALGSPSLPAEVQFDGEVFTLCATGSGLMLPLDEGHFVAAAPSVSRMQIRFVPQVASQFAMFGLACRASLAANAPAVALLISPATGERGRRGWSVQMTARDSSGAVTALSESPLASPVVNYGRLIKPVWLRLESTSTLIEGSFSTDGVAWGRCGQWKRLPGSRIGLVAASGIPEVSSTVRFEVQSIDRSKPLGLAEGLPFAIGSADPAA